MTEEQRAKEGGVGIENVSKRPKMTKRQKRQKKRTKDKRGGRGWVSEKCSGQGSERNQIRETIMVELMGTRGRYLNVIFTNIARNGSNKSKKSVIEYIQFRSGGMFE